MRDLYAEVPQTQFIYDQMQGFNLTRALINKELSGIFNTETLKDMKHTLEMYRIYAEGADFNTDQSSNDYVPTQWHSKQIKTLIDKEARFLFADPPDIELTDVEENDVDATRIQPNQDLVRTVLKSNRFNSKIVRAAKDCLIGKRIAIAVNFNEESGIDISFVPSLEFIYETDPADVDTITKFIQFYNVTINDERSQQRIYKKKWYMKKGMCRVVEELYDGAGNLVEEITPDQLTRLDRIPVAIIINEGLTGDPFGTSDVESLKDTESCVSKLSSKDIDSLRKGTDQITYAIDADPKTTKGLSRRPGAFWDLASDPVQDQKTAQVGTLDNPMTYATALDATLARLKADMYAQLDVPDTNSDSLQGIITSGKTMQAIYWGLMVRCDEKMLDWIPGLEFMVETIIEGGKAYPEIARKYVSESLVDGYEIRISNNYPILQDKNEEKASDLLEVNSQTLSRKSYMKKWYGLTDSAIESELKQIKFEQEMLNQDNYLFANDSRGGSEGQYMAEGEEGNEFTGTENAQKEEPNDL